METTIKVTAINEEELNFWIDWYKKRFPNYTKARLNKFIKAIKGY